MDQKDELEFEITDTDQENDLDIEIVDLTDNDTPEQNVIASSVQHPPRTPRFTLQQRRIQLLVTVSVVILLLLVLLDSYTPVRDRLAQTFIPPTPVSTVRVGSGVTLFYFDANPTWVQLFIDGKRISHLPSFGNAKEAPIRLMHGRHVLLWVAAPFMSQQCTVSVPFNDLTDTCHFDQVTHYSNDNSALLFQLSVSLAQLSYSSFTNLVTTAQTELDTHAPTETVLPGELYAIDIAGGTTSQSMRRATKPLKATLRYQLDVENTLDGVCSTLTEESTPCTFNGQECYLFCTNFSLPRSANTQTASWDVFAAVQASWEYSTQDGTVLAQNQPELLGTSVIYDHLLPLHITWDGTHWHVALRTFQDPSLYGPQLDAACNTALNAVKSVLVPTNSEQAHLGINWQYISSANLAEGCLSIATLNAGLGASAPPVAYCLHRFGVFLAANTVAHRYWPTMPVADAHEQQLAQQLAASQYAV